MNRGIKLPDQIYPMTPTTSGSFMPYNIPDPSINEESFNQLIRNRGVRFIHRKAAICPNVETMNSNQHDPNCELCDHDGWLYYQEKEIFGIFIGNTMEKIFEYQGMWEVGTTMASFPTQYPDGSEADFNTMDKLVMPDFEVRMPEEFEYKGQADRTVSLRYPITGVEFMGRAQDSKTLITYEDGVDFDIVNGSIVFRSGHEPNYDETNRRGDVISISFFANPVYIVLYPLREVRVTQELVNGQKIAKRFPQQLVIKRDFMANAEGRAARVIK